MLKPATGSEQDLPIMFIPPMTSRFMQFTETGLTGLWLPVPWRVSLSRLSAENPKGETPFTADFRKFLKKS